MKRLLKKKWHRIPVGIMSVVLALVLVAGSAFAAYDFLNGTVEVEVGEPFTFGVNYMGWEAPPGADMEGGYYSQSSPFTSSVSLKAGEATHGNPSIPEPERDLMPLLVKDTTSHTFNSMQVANAAGLPITVTFTVTGETAKVYMVTWEGGNVLNLNGYTQEVPANGFIMRGIGVVAQGDAAPIPHTFTITVSRS